MAAPPPPLPPKKPMGAVGEAGGYKASLNELQVSKFKRAFKAQDKDKDGTVTAAELVIVYAECGVKITEAEALDMIKTLDINGDNKIDFEEFLKVASKRLLDEEVAKEELSAALKAKADSNGFILTDEFKKVLVSVGWTKRLIDEKVELLAHEGKVKIEEFFKI